MISHNSLPIPVATTCELICKHTQLHLPLAKSIGWFSALIFLGLWAAFDTSDHSASFLKLYSFGFVACFSLNSPHLLALLSSLLHDFPFLPFKDVVFEGSCPQLTALFTRQTLPRRLLHFHDSVIPSPFL